MALYRLGQFATEAIAFQDSKKLFLDLTTAIVDLRAARPDPSNTSLWHSPEINKLTGVIEKHTNLMFTLEDSGWVGPAVWTPRISNNHIFNQEGAEEAFVPAEDHIRTLLRQAKKKNTVGSVDLATGKVTGAYAKMIFNMLMPASMLLGKQYTPEEVAAIMLHEIGHVITFCEMVGRCITTNQVMSSLTRLLDKSVTESTRITMFTAAADELKLNKDDAEVLRNAKTQEEVVLVVLGKHQEEAVSELGYNAYDVSSCEQMADQFAARQGAGRDLTTGLDKMYTEFGMTKSATRTMLFIDSLLVVMLPILWVVTGAYPLIPLYLALVIFLPSKEQLYDNPHARMTRIKHEAVERLKDKKISDQLRKNLLDDIKVYDEILDKYEDRLNVYEEIAYLVRPGFRNKHKIELLQKSLERLASNNLFVDAQKLKTV